MFVNTIGVYVVPAAPWPWPSDKLRSLDVQRGNDAGTVLVADGVGEPVFVGFVVGLLDGDVEGTVDPELGLDPPEDPDPHPATTTRAPIAAAIARLFTSKPYAEACSASSSAGSDRYGRHCGSIRPVPSTRHAIPVGAAGCRGIRQPSSVITRSALA